MVVGRVNALLHDATAVHMASDLCTISHHGLIDELFLFRLPRVQNLLDHVVPVYFESEHNKHTH